MYLGWGGGHALVGILNPQCSDSLFLGQQGPCWILRFDPVIAAPILVVIGHHPVSDADPQEEGMCPASACGSPLSKE